LDTTALELSRLRYAIGSFLYLMTRDYEPCKIEDFEDGIHRDSITIRRFQLLEIPSLGVSQLDQIIKRCWYSEYEQFRELAEETNLP
jgi:hypothetical protein